MNMKLLTLLFVLNLSGCVTPKPVVPELAGKPRVKINKQDSVALDSEFPKAEVAPAPTEKNLKDSKGSKKNVHKTINGGNTPK